MSFAAMKRRNGKRAVDTTSQLKLTSSDIENAKAAIAAGEKEVAAAQARILEAEAENVKAQDDVQRYHLLLAKDEIAKIQRLIAAGTPQEKAIEEVDTIDRDRAAFVKTYLKLNWPECQLYDAMFNTERGDSYVAEVLAHCAGQVAT